MPDHAPANIPMLTTTAELEAFCARAAEAPYVTVDTEFLRERTYYSQLCLVQLAYRGDGKTDAVLVDPLSDGLSLDPLYELFKNINVVKVFHAARQDLEIFYVDQQVIPTPLFDTQIAAMVCGYGDQVGYETLVRRICKASLDKSSRFTDWSNRPLNAKQASYALGDVTYLRDIYERLSAQLEKSGRARWLDEELSVLNDPNTYVTHPEDAWQRLKMRNPKPRFVAIARELAALRERLAQERNIPRNRIYKDDALLELAAAAPSTPSALSRMRLLQREARQQPLSDSILAAIEAGQKADLPPEQKQKPDRSQTNGALAELLRVLLKAKSEELGVASRLIASASDLDAFAQGERNLPMLRGWRRDAFGNDALRLSEGKMGLGVNGTRVVIVPLAG